MATYRTIVGTTVFPLIGLGGALSVLLLLTTAGWGYAEGDTPASDVVVRAVELPDYRVSKAPAGPRLCLPTDLIAHSGDSTDPSAWNLDEVFENGTWLPFDEAPFEEWAIPLRNVVELLSLLSEDPRTREETVDVSASETGIVIEGPAHQVQAAETRLSWVLDGLAPSVGVRAVLRGGEAGAERLLAMGRARLWPNRWTRVYLQEDAVPCVVALHLDVAQESTVMDPHPANVPQGEELYLRYHPGQSKALIEVWAGTTVHTALVRQDLSDVRNVPEASGPGVLSYPETAVARTFTACVLPSGLPATRELRWNAGGRELALRLDFDAPPAPQAPTALGDEGGLAAVRIGAVGQALEFGARSQSSGRWEDRVSRIFYDVAADREREGGRFEFSVSSVNDGSVLLVEAPRAELARAREAVEEVEQDLGEGDVSVRLLSVPQRSFQSALRDGKAAIGEPLDEAVVADWEAAGAPVVSTLHAPVLRNMRVGFRLGKSIPGIVDFNSEIAQASGGLQPLTSARFAGLVGELHLRSLGRARGPSSDSAAGVRVGGHALRVAGELSWADREAGSMELLFRPSRSLRTAGSGKGLSPEESQRHKVRVPILGGGRTPVEMEVRIPPGDKRERLLHAHVRGDEVFLLLGSLR